MQGNYNTLGWLVTLADRDWWQATNHGAVKNDLYSIAHHEIGHALIFNPNNSLVRCGAARRWTMRGSALISAAFRP